MAVRNIVRIDEEKCNGCGLCVDACVEGAIQLVDGKARLVKDSYCDGLGACIGECPQGTITIEVREADEFDAEQAHKHVERMKREERPASQACTFTCPGAAVKTMSGSEGHNRSDAPAVPSSLRNWPVQLMLVPPTAPYLENADLLLAADCVPFAYADFHRLLEGKILIIGCPKLDEIGYYTEKLTQILQMNNIRSLTVSRMEVPCCSGLIRILGTALDRSGKDIPVVEKIISIKGEVL